MEVDFKNPYRPGAGHMPPFLAGREKQFEEFERLLDQDEILENMILTGLRGVGKTVLLERFKPLAIDRGWVWIGTDLSEAASISETNLATRLIADLSVATSGMSFKHPSPGRISLTEDTTIAQSYLTYPNLVAMYEATPGLVTDKIKAVLEFAAGVMAANGKTKAVFAYDEAQNLADHASADQYPLSALLDVFQSIQRKGIAMMLVLTGLPTLFPKLVESRTYSERMFRVVTLGQLDPANSEEAIQKPVDVADCPVSFDKQSVAVIRDESGGYPYFIQFICREVFDVFIQQLADGSTSGVMMDGIQRKLDSDFFAGRWARATDRQRELMWVIAQLDRPDVEFTIQELVGSSRELLQKSFSPSHASQMLSNLTNQGLIYKNRFGKYSFAVPLLGSFILRTYAPEQESLTSAGIAVVERS